MIWQSLTTIIAGSRQPMRLKSMQNSPLRLRPLQKGKRRRLQHRNLLHPPRRPPQLALYRRRDYQRWAGTALVKAALSKICFDVQQITRQSATKQRNEKDGKDISIFGCVCRNLIAGPGVRLPGQPARFLPFHMEENCITYIRLRPRTGSWLAIKRSTMPTNRRLWHRE